MPTYKRQTTEVGARHAHHAPHAKKKKNADAETEEGAASLEEVGLDRVRGDGVGDDVAARRALELERLRVVATVEHDDREPAVGARKRDRLEPRAAVARSVRGPAGAVVGGGAVVVARGCAARRGDARRAGRHKLGEVAEVPASRDDRYCVWTGCLNNYE